MSCHLPVCLPLSAPFVLVLFLLSYVKKGNSLLVYDCQTLLDLHLNAINLVRLHQDEQEIVTESTCTCLVPVAGLDVHTGPPCCCFAHLRRCRVNFLSLQRLNWVPRTTSTQALVPTRMAMVNVRSSTRTFILNDFSSSSGLDFLCVIGSWLNMSESSVFSELLPTDCTYFNAPRLSGQGGGILTVFKKFNCKHLSISTPFSSFEQIENCLS